MSDRHITDEEIHQSAGRAPRDPPGTPKATCLACRHEYTPHYAIRAHECRLNLADRKPYWEWLLLFQVWGWGVLKTAADRKFMTFDKPLSGRQMLTEFLQSNIETGTGTDLNDSHYRSDDFVKAGFPI